ncbi:MAG: DUF3795 domain-containing protein [Spirochaetes bacterium]|nr:DUF3795 domain-containing protein [Spirochaetota bacterium]
MDYIQLTAPCGLDCFNCPMYQALTNEELRNKIAKSMNIPEEKAVCQGCRNEKGTIGFMNMQKPCSVYACAQGKGISFCYECDDFPCDNLHPYADKASQVPHNTKVFNLCLIKKMGLEKWALEKAKNVKKTYFSGKFTLTD